MYIYVISATTPLSPPQTPVNKGKERTYLADNITKTLLASLVTAFSASPVSAIATSALYVRTVITDEARFSGFKFILVF